MDLTEFIDSLEECRDLYPWHLDVHGRIRSETQQDGEWYDLCPITAVFLSRWGEMRPSVEGHHVGIKMGLSDDLADQIIDAADYAITYGPRPLLLKALGLEG